MSVALVARSRGVLRYSSWDSALIALSGVYAALLLWAPSSALIAVGLWWTANTVAHNFIHTPFFRSRAANRVFALYLSALMGFPQGLWRDRHLRHHRGDERPTRWTRGIAVEFGIVLGVWLTMVAFAPWFFVSVYVPGYLLGLGLCHLQGHFEHAGGTTSHYGWLYNRLFFNDGYHVEHHRHPGEHWTRLPLSADPHAHRSRWPPVLRWLDTFDSLRSLRAGAGSLRSLSVGTLERLERIALRSAILQRYLIASHERAFRTLLARMPRPRRVTIVGGGLFPRTALILRKLLPDATLAIVDAQREHLEIARGFFEGEAGEDSTQRPRRPRRGYSEKDKTQDTPCPEWPLRGRVRGIELRHQFFDARTIEDADLVVVPLSFIGDRRAVYEHPPARRVMVHDWLWKAHGGGVRISWLLLKRLNLVTR